MPVTAVIVALYLEDMQVLSWHDVSRLLQSQALPSGDSAHERCAKYAMGFNGIAYLYRGNAHGLESTNLVPD